jgi:hypothetical protein
MLSDMSNAVTPAKLVPYLIREQGSTRCARWIPPPEADAGMTVLALSFFVGTVITP